MTYPGEQSRHLCAWGGGLGKGVGGGIGTQEVLHPKRAGHPAHQLWCTAGRRWQRGGHRLCHVLPRDRPSRMPHVSRGALPQQDASR